MGAQLGLGHPRGSDERRGADPSESGARPLPRPCGMWGLLRVQARLSMWGGAAIPHWRRRSEAPWEEPEQVHRIDGSGQAALGTIPLK